MALDHTTFEDVIGVLMVHAHDTIVDTGLAVSGTLPDIVVEEEVESQDRDTISKASRRRARASVSEGKKKLQKVEEQLVGYEEVENYCVEVRATFEKQQFKGYMETHHFETGVDAIRGTLE